MHNAELKKYGYFWFSEKWKVCDKDLTAGGRLELFLDSGLTNETFFYGALV